MTELACSLLAQDRRHTHPSRAHRCVCGVIVRFEKEQLVKLVTVIGIGSNQVSCAAEQEQNLSKIGEAGPALLLRYLIGSLFR